MSNAEHERLAKPSVGVASSARGPPCAVGSSCSSSSRPRYFSKATVFNDPFEVAPYFSPSLPTRTLGARINLLPICGRAALNVRLLSASHSQLPETHVKL